MSVKMNGPTLRISSKSKSRVPAEALPPVTLPDHHLAFFRKFDKYNQFLEGASADQQLAALKGLLSTDGSEEDDVRFIAAVYITAEPKHPLKCYLARYITKSNAELQHSFERCLASEVTRLISPTDGGFGRTEVSRTVTALVACSENFPSGVRALQTCRHRLVGYLEGALRRNVHILTDDQELSPTDKNEIFTLVHIILRALLIVFQKADSDDITTLQSFVFIYTWIDRLLEENQKDLPLDTKSLCGILNVTMGTLKHGQDYWIKFVEELRAAPCGDTYSAVNRVCAYAAMVTVVPVRCLEERSVGDAPGLVLLVGEVLKISERYSVEPLIALSVARTLLSVTKALRRSAGTAAGRAASLGLLSFVWAHIEHFTDSVRHLTEQVLANVLEYFGAHQDDSSPNTFDVFFAELTSLPTDKKAYYVGLAASAGVLGACAVLRRLPGLVPALVRALSHQPLQANVAATMSTLLKKHAEEASAAQVYESWVRPMLARVHEGTDADTLGVLENVISYAIKCDRNVMDFILPEAKRICSSAAIGPGDLKCVLVCLSLARRVGCLHEAPGETDKWRGVLGYDVVRMALVNASEEIRILALSLLIETSKSTEPFSAAELELFLYYLHYNVNTQSPSLRHLSLSLIKKLMKRLESSYRVLRRQDTAHSMDSSATIYKEFLNRLREQCFDSLLPGANYSRRAIALEVLERCEALQMEDYQSFWCEKYVDKLLQHLEDSYENNKKSALNVLAHCPVHYLEMPYSISLSLADVLHQASSVKPPDCMSAAYKLQLVQRVYAARGHSLLQHSGAGMPKAETVSYIILSSILDNLQRELRVAQESILLAASRGPMYGLLYCAHHVLAQVNASEIATEPQWTVLVASLIAACTAVTAAVGPVVNNSSPEGHLPMDGAAGAPHLASGGLTLDNGSTVTAQMVLLCAWRSVKEVSLLLGVISSELRIVGEGPGPGTLVPGDLLLMGEHFTTLLAETKHRGAFEQAYVGFTRLCTRLWQCKSAELHGLPRAWLSELTAAIAAGGRGGKLCATRRSAGLPFTIQALVTTELQVVGAHKCFHDCMRTLLRLASFDAANAATVETRTHCLNVLRALYRHAGLGAVIFGYVEDGLVTAVRGFEGTTWAERNSSTLLFSSLMVRIFGVQRGKDSDELCIRNKMTGRTFFLRYPSLYEFMLEKLKAAVPGSGSEGTLRPSLYPVLLLLARLYPYTLEETTTSLKLVAFAPHVLACAGSRVLTARRLAARALVPLVSCDKYVFYLNQLLRKLGDKQIKRNYCHGILLQLIRLLEWKPATLKVSTASCTELYDSLQGTLWMLEEVLSPRPCYITANEYLKLINLLLWRFPEVVQQEYTVKIKTLLMQLFLLKSNSNYYGRDIFLANAFKMLLILLTKSEQNHIPEVVIKHLDNESYDVMLSALNFILLLHKEQEESDCKFQKVMTEVIDDNVRKEILGLLSDNADYRKGLLDIVARKNYLECVQKALTILSLLDNTQIGLLCVNSPNSKLTSEEIVIKLLDKIQSEHENVSHIYVVSLHNFISKVLRRGEPLEEILWVEIVKVMYESCSSDNTFCKRSNVLSFLEDNALKLIGLQFIELSRSHVFEYHSTIWATLVTLLEDDEDVLRQRTANLVLKLANGNDDEILNQLIPSKASEVLLNVMETCHKDTLDAVAVFLILALLDFNSEVCIGDDITDECRVFDSNEKYNIFLEESNWTKECVGKIREILGTDDPQTIHDSIITILNSEEYSEGFENLCSLNYKMFVRLFRKYDFKEDSVNPKVPLCIKMLCK